MSKFDFHRTHEEDQGINFASSLFTIQLTATMIQILTGHVTVKRISMVARTSVLTSPKSTPRENSYRTAEVNINVLKDIFMTMANIKRVLHHVKKQFLK